jgi:hypothetical protein
MTRRSDRHETDPVDPFFGFRRCPDQEQFLDGGADFEALGYDDDAGTGLQSRRASSSFAYSDGLFRRACWRIASNSLRPSLR